MNKAQEIEILTEAANKLGPNSYLGPWLLEIKPELESILRSDFLPQLSLREAEATASRIVEEAKNKANGIEMQARKEAFAIVDKANKEATDIRHRLLSELKRAETILR